MCHSRHLSQGHRRRKHNHSYNLPHQLTFSDSRFTFFLQQITSVHGNGIDDSSNKYFTAAMRCHHGQRGLLQHVILYLHKDVGLRCVKSDPSMKLWGWTPCLFLPLLSVSVFFFFSLMVLGSHLVLFFTSGGIWLSSVHVSLSHHEGVKVFGWINI